MNQSGQDKQLAALEQAIMARAAHLAGEFQEKAERQRDHILRDAAERLHNAEEREVRGLISITVTRPVLGSWANCMFVRTMTPMASTIS